MTVDVGGGGALVGVLVGGAVPVRVVDGVSVMLGVAVPVAGFVGVGDEVPTLVTVDVGGAGAGADRYTKRCSPAASAMVCVPKFRPGSAIVCVSDVGTGWSVGLFTSTAHS